MSEQQQQVESELRVQLAKAKEAKDRAWERLEARHKEEKAASAAWDAKATTWKNLVLQGAAMGLEDCQALVRNNFQP